MAWGTYTCKINGKMAQVLIDNRFQGQTPISKLPLITWVGIYCCMPSGVAFNNPKETKILNEIEDRMIKLFSDYGNGLAVYTHRIGTPGIREYYIYHGEEVDLNEAFNILMSLYPKYKMEIESTKDDKWTEYNKYLII